MNGHSTRGWPRIWPMSVSLISRGGTCCLPPSVSTPRIRLINYSFLNLEQFFIFSSHTVRLMAFYILTNGYCCSAPWPPCSHTGHVALAGLKPDRFCFSSMRYRPLSGRVEHPEITQGVYRESPDNPCPLWGTHRGIADKILMYPPGSLYVHLNDMPRVVPVDTCHLSLSGWTSRGPVSQSV